MDIEDIAEGVLPHSAEATWSGFIYQGRVALYHVLTLLIEKTEEEMIDLFIQISEL